MATRITIGCLLLLLLSSCSTKSQVVERVICAERWDSVDVINAVDQRVTNGAQYSDLGVLSEHDGKLAFTKPSGLAGEDATMAKKNNNRSLATLSLLTWEIKNVSQVTIRSALFLCSYFDSGKRQWALMIVSKTGTSGPYKFATNNLDEEQSIARYDHSPSLDELNAFIKSEKPIESHSMSYNSDGKYNWNGIDIELEDAGVCEDAWIQAFGKEAVWNYPKSD